VPLLIIASISIVVSFIIINYSSFGKKIEMIGLSSSASKYAGIKVKKNMLISMCISGAFAGLLGVMIYCAQKGQLETTIISKSIPGEGFAGVAIGLISMNNPISIFPISLLFGAVENSKGVIQQECFVDPYFVDLMFGIIVYGAAIISIMYRFKP
jgi:simple sugar transport system permease protein